MLHSALGESVSQVIELVELSHDIYQHKPAVANSTIGQHIRHIIDHFDAYRRGIDTSCIDYNIRSRDSELETTPTLAMQKLKEFELWLDHSPRESFELSLVTEVSTLDRLSISLQSNSHRELVYLLNHSYHHVALAATLARTLGLAPSEKLGVAPATATYRRDSSLSCAP
ncbi:MAG: DinB family protein [Cellvibrionaceae bacterium]